MASKTDNPYLIFTNPRVRARGDEYGGIRRVTGNYSAAFVITLRSNAFQRRLICR